MNPSLKIVLICFSENSLGRRIINLMMTRGIIPCHVFMASEKALTEFRKKGIRRYFKQNGIYNTFWRVYYRLTTRKDVRDVSLKEADVLRKSIKEVCSEHNIPIGYFDNVNSDAFTARLKAIEPDLVVLGGAPLLKKHILDLPKIAVINSHPGILPQAKGMDVVSQSILDDVPLGVTVFKVDAGMDSGPVLMKRLLTEDINGKKLHELEAIVERLSAEAMLDAIEKIINNDYEFIPQKGKGKIYKALTHNKYKQVLAKLKRY
jgi:methionyl-tRNA formyltransferase